MGYYKQRYFAICVRFVAGYFLVFICGGLVYYTMYVP